MWRLHAGVQGQGTSRRIPGRGTWSGYGVRASNYRTLQLQDMPTGQDYGEDFYAGFYSGVGLQDWKHFPATCLTQPRSPTAAFLASSSEYWRSLQGGGLTGQNPCGLTGQDCWTGLLGRAVEKVSEHLYDFPAWGVHMRSSQNAKMEG